MYRHKPLSLYLQLQLQLQLLRIDHEYCTILIGKHLGYYWSPDVAACTGSDYTQMEDSTMTALIERV